MSRHELVLLIASNNESVIISTISGLNLRQRIMNVAGEAKFECSTAL